jgi:dihydrofolate reductase
VRHVVLAMMTILDGRLDDPEAFVTGVDDAQYAQIDRRFEDFDTILIGTATYTEMNASWPGALADEHGFVDSDADINQRMARKMNDYRKYVITHRDDGPLEWNNSERSVVSDDDALRAFVAELENRPGKNIHLAGGAELAGHFGRLGLIDECRFMVYPCRPV